MAERDERRKIGDKVKKSLDYSIKEGVSASVMSGAADNFVSPYAIALKASNFQLGLLSALSNLIPVEIITTKMMQSQKFSRKSIVLGGVFAQILILVLISLLGFLFLKSPSIAPILLILLFTIYASTSLFVSPAWSSWMKDLTEKVKIGKYFGIRSKICGIAGLITIVLVGIVLDVFKKANLVLLGFTLIFIIAAISRTISRSYLKKQYEPKLKLRDGYFFSFWQFIKKSPSNNYGKFVIFIALINFSVMIAGPFFTPYMLKDLGFNYITFTIINLVISGVATLLTVPLWGKFVDKFGCVTTMKITVWMVPIIPILWIASPSPYWLFVVQIISGITWAGFNLAAGTFHYETITKERMSLCIAYSSILNGVAIFLGAIIGGLIASLNISFMNIYLFIFLISGIARIIVISALFPLIKEVRSVKKLPVEKFRIEFHKIKLDIPFKIHFKGI